MTAEQSRRRVATDSQVVRDWLAEYVFETMRTETLEAVVDRLDRAIVARVPELADRDMNRDLAASTRAHARTMLSGLTVDTFDYALPEEAHTFARTVARRGYDLRLLLRTYHFGMDAVLDYMTDALDQREVPPEIETAVLLRLFDRATKWVNMSVELLTDTYMEERERVLRAALNRRTETVHALLAGRSSTPTRRRCAWVTGSPATTCRTCCGPTPTPPTVNSPRSWNGPRAASPPSWAVPARSSCRRARPGCGPGRASRTRAARPNSPRPAGSSANSTDGSSPGADRVRRARAAPGRIPGRAPGGRRRPAGGRAGRGWCARGRVPGCGDRLSRGRRRIGHARTRPPRTGPARRRRPRGGPAARDAARLPGHPPQPGGHGETTGGAQEHRALPRAADRGVARAPGRAAGLPLEVALACVAAYGVETG